MGPVQQRNLDEIHLADGNTSWPSNRPSSAPSFLIDNVQFDAVSSEELKWTSYDIYYLIIGFGALLLFSQSLAAAYYCYLKNRKRKILERIIVINKKRRNKSINPEENENIDVEMGPLNLTASLSSLSQSQFASRELCKGKNGVSSRREGRAVCKYCHHILFYLSPTSGDPDSLTFDEGLQHDSSCIRVQWISQTNSTSARSQELWNVTCYLPPPIFSRKQDMSQHTSESLVSPSTLSDKFQQNKNEINQEKPAYQNYLDKLIPTPGKTYIDRSGTLRHVFVNGGTSPYQREKREATKPPPSSFPSSEAILSMVHKEKFDGNPFTDTSVPAPSINSGILSATAENMSSVVSEEKQENICPIMVCSFSFKFQDSAKENEGRVRPILMEKAENPLQSKSSVLQKKSGLFKGSDRFTILKAKKRANHLSTAEKREGEKSSRLQRKSLGQSIQGKSNQIHASMRIKQVGEIAVTKAKFTEKKVYKERVYHRIISDKVDQLYEVLNTADAVSMAGQAFSRGRSKE